MSFKISVTADISSNIAKLDDNLAQKRHSCMCIQNIHACAIHKHCCTQIKSAKNRPVLIDARGFVT